MEMKLAVKTKPSSIPLSRSTLNDELVWRPVGSGTYSVKSGYRLLRDERLLPPGVHSNDQSTDLTKFYTELWDISLPAKVKITMWRIAHNFLPTFANLQIRRLNVNNVCSLCQSTSETIDHLMRDCWFSRQLLGYQGVHLPIGSISISWKDWLASFFVNLHEKHKKVYMISLWSIWFTRNKVVHEGCEVSVRESMSFVEAFLQENEVVQVASCPPITVAHGQWQAPIGDIVKLNFDAAYNAHAKESTSGVICRNDNGFIMTSCVYPHMYVADAFVAEALSCLQAVIFAKELGFRRVVIEGDSQTVIKKKVCSSNADGSLISPIVQDIKEASKDFESVAYSFVRREANNAAHTLAREGRSLCSPTYWIEEAPPGATSAARLDKEGLGLQP
ncbi:hypothetical protein V6N13_033540 [Hibiscus sabdariffa]